MTDHPTKIPKCCDFFFNKMSSLHQNVNPVTCLGISKPL